MSKVIHVNQQQFPSEVLQSDIPVIVDFYATWCPPCRALGPILDRLAEEFSGQIKIVKINSDEEPSLAEACSVTGLPTVIFFDKGTHVGQFSGLPQETALRDQIKSWVGLRKAVG